MLLPLVFLLVIVFLYAVEQGFDFSFVILQIPHINKLVGIIIDYSYILIAVLFSYVRIVHRHVVGIVRIIYGIKLNDFRIRKLLSHKPVGISVHCVHYIKSNSVVFFDIVHPRP